MNPRLTLVVVFWSGFVVRDALRQLPVGVERWVSLGGGLVSLVLCAVAWVSWRRRGDA